MKFRNVLTTLMLVLMCIAIPSSSKQRNDLNSIYTNSMEVSQNTNFIVNSNSELIASGLPGSGTQKDPFVLSEQVIDGTDLTDTDALVQLTNVNLWILITNNTLTNGQASGIRIDNCENIIIRDNLIQDTTNEAIGVFQSTSVYIEDNLIQTTVGAGIQFIESSVSHIENNTVIDAGGDGIAIAGISNHNLIANNTIRESSRGIVSNYWSGQVGSWNQFIQNNVSHCFDNGIVVFGNWNNLIFEGNEVSYSGHGIDLAGGDASRWFSGTQIIRNKLHDNLHSGLHIDGSLNVSIVDNDVYLNSAQGIWIGHSENLKIKRNLIHNNAPDSGLNLYYCSNSTISENIIHSGLEIGLLLEFSDFNKISFNFLLDNKDKGLSLVESNSNDVVYNNFKNNLQAIGSDGTVNEIHSNFYFNISYPDDQSPTSFANYDRIYEISFSTFDLGNHSFYKLNWDFSLTHNTYIEFEYDISYSIDLKESWLTLVTGLNEIMYDVNISKIPEFNVIFFRVNISDNYGFYRFVEDFPRDILNGRIVSSPIISKPESISTLQGKITIEWEESHDTLNLPLYYNVQYLYQGTDHWVLLEDNLTGTALEWDTTLFEDGEYLLKITVIDFFDFEYIYVSPGFYMLDNVIDIPLTSEYSTDGSPTINFSDYYIVSLILIPVVKRKRNMNSKSKW